MRSCRARSRGRIGCQSRSPATPARRSAAVGVGSWPKPERASRDRRHHPGHRPPVPREHQCHPAARCALYLKIVLERLGHQTKSITPHRPVTHYRPGTQRRPRPSATRSEEHAMDHAPRYEMEGRTLVFRAAPQPTDQVAERHRSASPGSLVRQHDCAYFSGPPSSRRFAALPAQVCLNCEVDPGWSGSGNEDAASSEADRAAVPSTGRRHCAARRRMATEVRSMRLALRSISAVSVA